MALRYLRSARRQAFVSFLSATAAGGMALGVAALVLALAALAGFQSTLRDEILARTPEIEVGAPAGSPAAELQARIAAVEGVVRVQQVTRGRGWLVSAGRVHPVEIVGYDGDVPTSFPGAAGGAPGLYLDGALGTSWGLAVGDVVELASTEPALTPLGPQPRVRRLDLAGFFDAGRSPDTAQLAVPLEEARRLHPHAPTRLVVSTGGLGTTDAVAARLDRALPPGSEILTWRELNRALFFALRLEKVLMFAAIFLIVIVAALSLVSDLNLILASKRHEVGMLAAMGASPAALRRIFVWLGLLLAGLGIALGLVVGAGTARLLDRLELLRLPDDVYFVDHVPFVVEPGDVLAVLAVTFVLVLVCCHQGGRRAAALRAVEALRR